MNVFDRLFFGDKSYFEIPIHEQESYLRELGEATDDYSRSFKQFRGQAYYMTWQKKIFLNLSSCAIVFFLLPLYMVRGIFIKRIKDVEAISRANEKEQFIPDTLIHKYSIERSLWNTKGAIQIKDIPFCLNLICRFFLHPYFLVKVIFKVAKYSSLIYHYSPKVIIVNDEFSFTSSILTMFCESHQVKHINVQHGEKLFFLRDSFFRFHECFIWDEHYRQLFISLKAEPSQFIIELPESMRFDIKKHFSKDLYADFKYYLGVYNEEELVSVIEAMKPLRNKGNAIKYRPHPNYSDMDLLRKYVAEDEIELPEVNILDSISSANYVVGVYSTVLTQAFFNGKEVVIDDIAFKKQYSALEDLDYILIDKVKNRLSMYQNI